MEGYLLVYSAHGSRREGQSFIILTYSEGEEANFLRGAECLSRLDVRRSGRTFNNAAIAKRRLAALSTHRTTRHCGRGRERRGLSLGKGCNKAKKQRMFSTDT